MQEAVAQLSLNGCSRRHENVQRLRAIDVVHLVWCLGGRGGGCAEKVERPSPRAELKGLRVIEPELASKRREGSSEMPTVSEELQGKGAMSVS